MDRDMLLSMTIPTCRDYAYVEALPDEKGATTAAFLVRALAFFRAKGVRIRRILTGNGKNYTSHLFRSVALAHRIALKLTRPYRPQTNGIPTLSGHQGPAERVGLCPQVPLEPPTPAAARTVHAVLQSPSTARRHTGRSPRPTLVNNVCGKYS